MKGNPSRLIVTAADSGYFRLAKGLVSSLRANYSSTADLVVLDLGLAPLERETLASSCLVMAPDMEALGAPGLREALAGSHFRRVHLLPRVLRCWLPALLPGYRCYSWVDADAWVQRGDALELFFTTAEGGNLALVPEIHRAYPFHYRNDAPGPRHFHARLEDGFGSATANPMRHLAILNSGVFAAAADHPIWPLWQARMMEALARATRHVSDQAALNVAVYSAGHTFVPLPASCNFLCCFARPRLDLDTATLTEPVPPFEPIGILHLTAVCNRPACVIPCSDGQARKLPLDYEGFAGAVAAGAWPDAE